MFLIILNIILINYLKIEEKNTISNLLQWILKKHFIMHLIIYLIKKKILNKLDAIFIIYKILGNISQKKGLTKNIYKQFYDNLIITSKSLPFKDLKRNKLIEFIKNNFKSLLDIKVEKNMENPKTILK